MQEFIQLFSDDGHLNPVDFFVIVAATEKAEKNKHIILQKYIIFLH